MSQKSGAMGNMLKYLAVAAIGAGAVAYGPDLVDKITPGAPVEAPKENIQIADNSRFVPVSKTDAQASYAPVVKKSSGAVVNVYARSIQKGRVGIDPFWGAFKIPDKASQSQGSGVIVRQDGVIVTNNHVVQNATELMVILSDKREYPAKILVADARSDLAVLKIDTGGQKLPFLNFADTSKAQVGDQVLAIGNPFGVGQTVTGGIISALARTDVGITDYSFFIQTDASINPGNSGGALVDMFGNLVGVNTAIFSQSGSSAGVGFAIPSEMVRRVVEGALNEGKIIRAWAGVKGQNVTAELAQTMKLPKPSGVIVTEVNKESAAASAGIKRGDVIVNFNGTEVADESGLRYLAATIAPKQKVKFDFYRDGKLMSGEGVLTAIPGNNPTQKKLNGQNSFGGATLADVTPYLADNLGIDAFSKGVVVLNVDDNSLAQKSGFQRGDIIIDINGEAVSNISDLEAKLGKKTQGEVTIIRDGRSRTGVIYL